MAMRNTLSRDIMQFGKPQTIRLLDVFAIGPFMVWASQVRTLPRWARLTLLTLGHLTIAYNAENYLKVKRWTPTATATKTTISA